MSAYDLTKTADRARLRRDRQAEVAAVDAGRWPRDIDDRFRWNPSMYLNPYLSSTTAADVAAKHAKKMCAAEVAYLDDVERRLRDGDPSLAGWER